MIRILVAFEGKHCELFLEHDAVTIGRSSRNSLRLPDRKLSREHARIDRDDLGYLLTDLQSNNGTWLNRRRVASGRLLHGDEIRVGGTVLHVLALGESSRPAAPDVRLPHPISQK